MKLKVIAIAFGLLFASWCSGQEVKTVAQCRAYREAWVTSTDTDTKNLSVRELFERAERMMACGREIDSKPLEAGVTAKEAIDVVIRHSSYAILAANYYREAFGRAAWFLDKKNLSKEFIAEDEDSKKR